jgi:hypothetical protein
MNAFVRYYVKRIRVWPAQANLVRVWLYIAALQDIWTRSPYWQRVQRVESLLGTLQGFSSIATKFIATTTFRCNNIQYYHQLPVCGNRPHILPQLSLDAISASRPGIFFVFQAQFFPTSVWHTMYEGNIGWHTKPYEPFFHFFFIFEAQFYSTSVWHTMHEGNIGWHMKAHKPFFFSLLGGSGGNM